MKSHLPPDDYIVHKGVTYVKVSKCEELALACHKLKRHLQGSEKPDTSNLIEEIADVEIMTAQIKILLNCENLVDKVKDKKIQRQIRRMEVSE